MKAHCKHFKTLMTSTIVKIWSINTWPPHRGQINMLYPNLEAALSCWRERHRQAIAAVRAFKSVRFHILFRDKFYFPIRLNFIFAGAELPHESQVVINLDFPIPEGLRHKPPGFRVL